MNNKLKIILPLVVLAVGIVGAIVLVKARSDVKIKPALVLAPLIRVETVQHQDLQLTVSSQGSVMPRTETTLAARVSGSVIKTSPAFADGGFFEKNEVLITIDPRDYSFAVTQAKSQVAQAMLRLAREKEEALVAIEEWQNLGKGQGGPLTTRELQIAEAEAGLSAAEAMHAQAQLNLERTRIRAPFAGRVRRKNVDIGQFVTPGVPLAQIYSIDFAEIRLPIPDDELAYIDLPMSFRGKLSPNRGPKVTLTARFAGKEHSWQGHIARIDGEIDARTRMVHLIAQVKDPYGRSKTENRPPLAVGLFAKAEIAGQKLKQVVIIPRAIIRGTDQVLVVDADSRLWLRTVEILRVMSEKVVLQSGLSVGEKICVSTIDAVVDGMKVRTIDENLQQNSVTKEGTSS